MARKCLGSIAASAHAASWGSGGITTRRPSRSPSRSKRAAKASKSAIDFRTPRPIRVGPATNSRSPLDETHVSGATLSASGFQNPSARMTLRRPHWPFRRPEKWTITVGTRKPGEQSRCSSLLSSFHFQESAWHLRKEGKKTPYGKWEKSHSGARRSDEWAAVHYLVEALVRLERDKFASCDANVGALHASGPLPVLHELGRLRRALLALETGLVKLHARCVAGSTIQRRDDDVVHVSLLVSVRKVGRCRPRGVRQLRHCLRVVCEAIYAAIELLEDPRGRVASFDVLHVEHARVDKRIVRLNDERVVSVDCLEDWVRVGEPDRVGIEMQHVEPVGYDQALQKNFARLKEGERNLVEHGVVQGWRPRSAQPCWPPHARERWHRIPQVETDLLFERED
eukprot:scaffold312469_cov31-Tisochrysis_lutea.AAC.2